jgi:hypothetical protein
MMSLYKLARRVTGLSDDNLSQPLSQMQQDLLREFTLASFHASSAPSGTLEDLENADKLRLALLNSGVSRDLIVRALEDSSNLGSVNEPRGTIGLYEKADSKTDVPVRGRIRLKVNLGLLLGRTAEHPNDPSAPRAWADSASTDSYQRPCDFASAERFAHPSPQTTIFSKIFSFG